MPSGLAGAAPGLFGTAAPPVLPTTGGAAGFSPGLAAGGGAGFAPGAGTILPTGGLTAGGVCGLGGGVWPWAGFPTGIFPAAAAGGGLLPGNGVPPAGFFGRFGSFGFGIFGFFFAGFSKSL